MNRFINHNLSPRPIVYPIDPSPTYACARLSSLRIRRITYFCALHAWPPFQEMNHRSRESMNPRKLSRIPFSSQRTKRGQTIRRWPSSTALALVGYRCRRSIRYYFSLPGSVKDRRDKSRYSIVSRAKMNFPTRSVMS